MPRLRNFTYAARNATLLVAASSLALFGGCPQQQAVEPPPPENIWDLGDVVWTQTGGEEPPYMLTVDPEFRDDILNVTRSRPVTGDNITDGTVTSADLDPTTVNNFSNTTIQQLNSTTSTGLLDGSAIRAATLRASAFVTNMFSTLPVDQGGLPDGSIHGSKLINGTVTPEKLSFSVTSAGVLAAGAGLALSTTNNVSTISITVGGVTAAMLAPDAIDAIAQQVLAAIDPGSLPGGTLAPGSVGATEIGDGAVGSSELADGSVTAPKLAPTLFADGSTPPQLAPGTIHGSKLAAGTVNGDRLVNASVSSGQINMADLIAALQASALFGGVPAGSIPPGAIQPGITGAQIADGSLTGADVQDGSLTGADIQDGSLTGADLAADTITAAQIAPSAIGSSELADNSVDSAAIINGQVMGPDLATGAVGSAAIAAGAVGEAALSPDILSRIAPPGTPFGDITAIFTPESGGLLGQTLQGDAMLTINPTLSLGPGTPPTSASLVLRTETGAGTFNALALGSFGGGMLSLGTPTGSERVQLGAGSGGTQATSSLRLYGRAGSGNTPRVSIEGGNEDPAQDDGGTLQLQNENGAVTAQLFGGADNTGAILSMQNGDPDGPQGPLTNQETIRLDATYGSGGGALALFGTTGGERVRLQTQGDGGSLNLSNVRGEPTFSAVANDEDGAGRLYIRRGPLAEDTTVRVSGSNENGGGAIWLSNGDPDGPQGPLTNQETISIQASAAEITTGPQFSFRNPATAQIVGRFGAANRHSTNGAAEFELSRADGTWSMIIEADSDDLGTPRAKLSSRNGGGMTLYGSTNGGRLEFTNAQNNISGVFETDTSLGGRIAVNNGAGSTLIEMLGDDPAVPANDDALLRICGAIRARTGSLTGGCDLAETFEHSDDFAAQPGMVMVIDPENPGKLTVSAHAYDKRVAGIISGAGDLKPGVSLGQRADGSTDNPLALAGRVYCYVDATEHAVEVGDMLTTADTPGHAMKATDPTRAFGCVLGKAMQPMAKGEKGLVLVLVSLQ